MAIIMKKLISKIGLFLIVLTLLFVQSANFFAADSYITLYGFSFDITNNEAVIHLYDDRSADVVIPEKLMGANVVAIDDYAFFNDNVITSVSFEKALHLRYIGIDAFYGCSEIKSLNIPSAINTIQYGAFQNCTGLESATIEDGLTSIDKQAFMGCGSLKYIVIPDSVTSISDTAFKNCDNLVIHCGEGSYAQTYAEEQNIPYMIIGDYKLGDVNLDGKVNIRDVTYIQLYRVGNIERLPEYRGRGLGDINGDGEVTMRDATLIQLYRAGYDVPYNIDKTVS